MQHLSDTSRCVRSCGFSLVELMVVLSIVSTLLAVGIPSFTTLIQNQRLTATVSDFSMALGVARSEAIRRGLRVDLAPADGADWGSGWVVFIDKNNNQRADAGDQIVFVRGQVSKKVAVKSAFTDSRKLYVAYNSAGRTRTNASNQSPQLGTISFVSDDRVRRIKLNFLGRARICNPENDKTCTGSDEAS